MLKRSLGLLTLALACALLAGCGAAASLFSSPSPFVGTWSGAFTESSASRTGTLSMTVTKAGLVAGILTTNANVTGPVTGQIVGSGAATITMALPNDKFTCKGGVNINALMQLKGTFTDTGGSQASGVSQITLSKQ
ncbi:MAG: hypothetical protein KGJ62_05800 [Armatimonadetes bacterium]|nr:hypothetical protein [Armatimonadota bacterium]MDE2206008.1 hypothetical protein [Armatimonadota bacterium]